MFWISHEFPSIINFLLLSFIVLFKLLIANSDIEIVKLVLGVSVDPTLFELIRWNPHPSWKSKTRSASLISFTIVCETGSTPSPIKFLLISG